jgi:hypothetical protein
MCAVSFPTFNVEPLTLHPVVCVRLCTLSNVFCCCNTASQQHLFNPMRYALCAMLYAYFS